jgi:hypothetical protein
VTRIEQTIREISTIASLIADALQQQDLATAEIARNVTQTADAANEMTSRIGEVSSEAVDTGRLAVEVRDNIVALSQMVEDLRHSVIRAVRSSTYEVDRARRCGTRLICQLDGALAAKPTTSPGSAIFRKAAPVSAASRTCLKERAERYILMASRSRCTASRERPTRTGYTWRSYRTRLRARSCARCWSGWHRVGSYDKPAKARTRT